MKWKGLSILWKSYTQVIHRIVDIVIICFYVSDFFENKFCAIFIVFYEEK